MLFLLKQTNVVAFHATLQSHETVVLLDRIARERTPENVRDKSYLASHLRSSGSLAQEGYKVK